MSPGQGRARRRAGRGRRGGRPRRSGAGRRRRGSAPRTPRWRARGRLSGDVPEPRRVLAVGDPGVHRQHHRGVDRGEEPQHLAPPGRVLGQQHPGGAPVAERDLHVAARDRGHRLDGVGRVGERHREVLDRRGDGQRRVGDVPVAGDGEGERRPLVAEQEGVTVEAVGRVGLREAAGGAREPVVGQVSSAAAGRAVAASRRQPRPSATQVTAAGLAAHHVGVGGVGDDLEVGVGLGDPPPGVGEEVDLAVTVSWSRLRLPSTSSDGSGSTIRGRTRSSTSSTAVSASGAPARWARIPEVRFAPVEFVATRRPSVVSAAVRKRVVVVLPFVADTTAVWRPRPARRARRARPGSGPAR